MPFGPSPSIQKKERSTTSTGEKLNVVFGLLGGGTCLVVEESLD